MAGGLSGRRFTAAVVRAAPVGFNPEATLAKTINLATLARSAGADLPVFPEAFLSSYPRVSTSGRSSARGAMLGATCSSAAGTRRSTCRVG